MARSKSFLHVAVVRSYAAFRKLLLPGVYIDVCHDQSYPVLVSTERSSSASLLYSSDLFTHCEMSTVYFS